MGQPTFSWNNYFRPTPKNIQRIVSGVRKVFVVATGTSVITNAPDWVTLVILAIGAALEETSNFFGEVAHDAEQVVVEFPKAVADQVSVSVRDVESNPPTTNVNDGEIK
jgi:hypothetical protein